LWKATWPGTTLPSLVTAAFQIWEAWYYTWSLVYTACPHPLVHIFHLDIWYFPSLFFEELPYQVSLMYIDSNNNSLRNSLTSLVTDLRSPLNKPEGFPDMSSGDNME
jgi:hypothetical protein